MSMSLSVSLHDLLEKNVFEWQNGLIKNARLYAERQMRQTLFDLFIKFLKKRKFVEAEIVLREIKSLSNWRDVMASEVAYHFDIQKLDPELESFMKTHLRGVSGLFPKPRDPERIPKNEDS